jgi:hypothetical protein
MNNNQSVILLHQLTKLLSGKYPIITQHHPQAGWQTGMIDDKNKRETPDYSGFYCRPCLTAFE